jgi:hypothetical protein
MPRKKAKETDRLNFQIKTRVNAKKYRALQALLAQSRHQTMSELVRDILHNKAITVVTHDDSLDQFMEQLVAIRQELKAIGLNINQITHYFNSTTDPQQKAFYALKVAGQYGPVHVQVEQVLSLISQLTGQWLQK